jgi:arylsulfatase A-like enzyme
MAVVGRVFLGAACFVGACAAYVSPNLVLLVLDDIGWGDVGFHGGDFPTPNIDRSVRDGVELGRMYAMPECSPTRAAVMTGRYSFTTGMQHWTTLAPGSTAHVPSDTPMISENIKAYGYSTHAIGKWHLGASKWAHTPVGRGFDSYLGHLQGKTDYYNRTFQSCSAGLCFFKDNCEEFDGKTCVSPMVSPYGPNAAGLDWWRDETASLERFGHYTVDDYMNEFRRVVRAKAVTQKPFFVYFAQQLLHVPIEVPPEPQYLEACRGVVGGYAQNNRTKLCAMAARLDTTFAEIETTLRNAGEWDNTLLWVFSDNGGMTAFDDHYPASASCNWPLRGGKTTLYEGGVRVLSFVYGGWQGLPAAARGSVRTELTHAVDIHPTLLHLASGARSGSRSFNGEDVWGTITGTAPTNRTELALNVAINRDLSVGISNPFAHNARAANFTAVIMWPWKIIVGEAYVNPRPELNPRGGWFKRDGYTYEPAPSEPRTGAQLFDLNADPNERHNVANEHPVVVARLMERVAYWTSGTAGYRAPQVNIPVPSANPRLHNWTWAPFEGESASWRHTRVFYA